MEKRARRRVDLQRMTAKARRLYPEDPQATRAEHLTTCSCWKCGNPRRYFGEPTWQEVRAEMVHRDEY